MSLFKAEPVNENDATSSWITGKPKALKAVRKILGPSDYSAHEGCNTGGANGVYWVEIVERRNDGLVVVSNITKGAKRKVESIQAAIEPDLIYLLERASEAFEKERPPEEGPSVRELNAKIGQLVMENDFLASALGKLHGTSAKR